VEEWEKRVGERSGRVKEAAGSLKSDLKAIEGELINLDFEKPRPGPNRIKEKFDALSSMIDESDDKPTRGAQEVYEMLRGQLDTQLGRLKELRDGRIAAFSDLLRTEGVPLVSA
jgi:hypothetical protein